MNATTLSKRRQLETFIAKNRAKASKASQARNKAKQLDRLQLIEIEGAEAEIRLHFPEIEPRQGPAVRTEHLAIGYPDRTVAEDVHVEVDHGWRVGVVGDNGQGKTTFLRTICGSLAPVDGHGHLGLRLRSRRLRPARLHDAARQRHGLRVSRTSGRAAHLAAIHQRRRRQLPVQRRAGRKENPRPVRRRTGPAGARRPAAQAAQRAGARRTGEPPRRRIGRSAGRCAHALPRHGDLHQPRPPLHAPRGDARDRSPRRPRRELPGQLRRLRLPHAKGNRLRPPRAPHGRHARQRAAPPRPPPTAKPAAAPTATLRRSSNRVERKIAKLDDEKKAVAAALLTVTDAAEAQRLHAEAGPAHRRTGHARRRMARRSPKK